MVNQAPFIIVFKTPCKQGVLFRQYEFCPSGLTALPCFTVARYNKLYVLPFNQLLFMKRNPETNLLKVVFMTCFHFEDYRRICDIPLEDLVKVTQHIVNGFISQYGVPTISQ